MDINNSEDDMKKNKNENEESSIYNYLKEHPGVLISGISALVVIFTFVINMTISFRTSKYLVYWGVDTLNLRIDNANQSYIFAVVCIYYMINMLIQPFFMNSYEIYVQEMQINYYAKYICKLSKKEVRHCKKNIDKIKREYRKLNKKEKDNTSIRDIEERVEKLKIRISEAEQARKKSSKYTGKKLVISEILVIVCSLIQMYIFVLTTTSITSALQTVLVSIIGAAISLSTLHSLAYLLIKKPVIATIRKEVYSDKADLENISKQVSKEIPEYPIDKIFSFKFRFQDIFTNKNIEVFAIHIIVCLIFLIVIVNPIDRTKMQEKKEFAVMSKGEIDYVIIYYDKEHYYLAEAMTEGETITIDTTKQRIIEMQDVVYENKIFKEVNRVVLEK